MEQNKNGFYHELLQVLKQDSGKRFYAENDDLLRNKVAECAMNLDKELIKLLLSNEKIKNKFFVKIDELLIFDKMAFVWAINNKAFLKDSYTRFKNNIGLIDSNEQFLTSKNDVVLSFPYKDCILEGGQTKEDQKRNEIYYNELLAPDDVDRLLAPKVFTNAKRYTKEGEENITSFNDDDNLLIKGNNLIALSSILKRYEGKVKCIYIDPPYNTRSEANTFAYNNTFNHSTWLTFMKNRLELAKKLLSDDGIIFIDIDHYELFYLGVLADEIFGYDNRLGVLAVVHNLKGRYSEFFSVAHENKLVYAKNAQNAIIKEYQYDTSENYPYEDEISRYKIVGLQRTGSGSFKEDRPNLFYPIYYNEKTNEIYLEEKPNCIKILPVDSKGIERRWRWGKDKVIKDWKTEIIVKKQKDEYKIYTKIRIKGERPKTLWNRPEYSGTTGTNELKNLVTHNVFSFPKAPQLVEDSIAIATDEDSIIVDFFGGSGTTAQAVLDLNKKTCGNRKFIIVEQMNYIKSATIPRIKAIIDKNEQGSFVYCELKELNHKFIDEIQVADDKKLKAFYSTITNSEFISYKAEINKLRDNEQEFEQLSTDDKKKFLIEVLDKNMLYVNYCDIDDSDFDVTEDEKAFTKSFYGDR